MKRYDDYIIYTDVDGTISTWDFVIPERNLKALEIFTKNGGRFGVATGRGRQGVEILTCLPFINMPSIMANGAVICNMKEEKPLFLRELPKKAKEIALTVRENMPNIPIMVWGERNRYVINNPPNSNINKIFPNSIFTTVEELNAPWAKLVFYLDPDKRDVFMEYLTNIAENLVEVSCSSINFVEVMPKDISKGVALEMIIKNLNLNRSQIHVMGDFNNDIPMLSLKGINSYCPLNAQPEVKNIAKHLLCDVADGALAELIEGF